jgi:hypothetical protein
MAKQRKKKTLKKVSKKKVPKKVLKKVPKRTQKRKKMKLSITETTYKELLRKKQRLTKKEAKQLSDSMYVKYCKCLQSFEYSNEKKGYPICMNSVYKRRNIQPPKNASKRCNIFFHKKT